MTENQSAIFHKSGRLSKWNIFWSTVRYLCQDFSIVKHARLAYQIPLDLVIVISDFLGHPSPYITRTRGISIPPLRTNCSAPIRSKRKLKRDPARIGGMFFWKTSKWRSDLKKYSKPSTSSWPIQRNKETCYDQTLQKVSSRKTLNAELRKFNEEIKDSRGGMEYD